MNDLNETNGLNGTGKVGNVGNDKPLPAAREAVIEQAQRVYQEVAHERDQLLRKVGELQSDIAGYKVALEAQSSQLASMDSRMAGMILTRDEAVRQCAEVRTVLHNIMTIGQPYLHSQLPVTPAEGQADDWELDQEAKAIIEEHQRQRPGQPAPVLSASNRGLGRLPEPR